ncbi:MAG: NAD(P)-dependent oxidoreductase [Persicimonas sp.]
MKIAIFGATGKTGSHLVEQALEAGYEVTAFVRDPSKLEVDPERLRIVEGDVREAESVARAIEGADVVISALGHTPTSKDDILSVAADHILAAMQEHEVERFITLLGAGVSLPGDPSSLGRKVMRGMMKLMVGKMLEDAQAHADKVRDSDLAWTIVRPPRLTDGLHTGEVEAGYLKLGPSNKISRADLAEFMLSQVDDDTWTRQAPMVTG